MTTESSSKRVSSKAKTGVFWNIEDCPIPDGLNSRQIFENIKSSLANEGYDHGEVSIRAYCVKKNRSFDELSLADITFVPAGDQLTRFKKILNRHSFLGGDILFWAVLNRVHYPETIHKVVVISKIPEYMKIAAILQALKSRDYIVLLAVPDALAYVSSVWLWPSLNPIDQSGSSDGVANKGKKLHEPRTGVFWNIDDRPIPKGLDLRKVNQNIKSALVNNFYHGDVSIWAYSENYGSRDEFVFYYSHCGITLQNKVLKDEYGDYSTEVDQMLVDILLWALDNPAPSNLMVISKDISEETELLSLLQALESKDYNILIAQTEEAASAVLLCTESSEWLPKSPKSLFGGGNPIDQSGSSRGVPNKGKKQKHHEACNTSVFWNIEDCPVPCGFDPHTFLQLIKSALANHGYHGEVSISAYCEKNRSLDDFSLTDITFVPTGNISARFTKMLNDILFWALENQKASNVMVITKNIPDNFFNVLQALKARDTNVLLAQPRSGYVSSVWLWPNLAGGGKRIDLSGSS